MADDNEPFRNLGFAEDAAVFASASQNVRVLSEGWMALHGFCPSCGAEPLAAFKANSPAADFHCSVCVEEYELKAQRGPIKRRIMDGAYGAMTARLKARNNPSLMVMSYDRDRARVTDLIVVPRHFFTADLIEARKPLGPNARRAGWQGCNILIGDVPLSGRIPLITGGAVTPRAEVVDRWRSTLFLKDASPNARGWLLAVMRAVEAVGRPEFTLDDVYAHEAALSALYPGNRNVRPKIRQQLQVLRDMGWLAFNGHGTYRRAG